MDDDRIRQAALNTPGGAQAQDMSIGARVFGVSSQDAQALATVYVGDQLARIADALEAVTDPDNLATVAVRSWQP